MRQDIIDLAQGAVWEGLGDSVEVFEPGADAATDLPIWMGTAIRIVPDPTDAPTEGLGYQQAVNGFSFRLDGAPRLKQKTLIRHAVKVWIVAEIAEVGNDQVRVTVFPN